MPAALGLGIAGVLREAGQPERARTRKHKSEHRGVVWRRSVDFGGSGRLGKELGFLSDSFSGGRGTTGWKSWERCGLHSKHVPDVMAGSWGAGCLAQ